MSARDGRLVLGPLLRYVDDTSAAVWVETGCAATVEVTRGSVSALARTFAVHGHHYALVELSGLAPGTTEPYTVAVDGEQVWPESGSPPLVYPGSRHRRHRSSMGKLRPKRSAHRNRCALGTSSFFWRAMGLTGNQYASLVAAYVVKNFGDRGIEVYRELFLGKTIIGKNRRVDILVLQRETGTALAIECKYQDALGSVDEKIPYALQDLEALWMPGCLVYAGKGWSRGVLHSLEASRLACSCLPDPDTLARSKETRELDHLIAAIFGLWELVLPPHKKFKPRAATS